MLLETLKAPLFLTMQESSGPGAVVPLVKRPSSTALDRPVYLLREDVCFPLVTADCSVTLTKPRDRCLGVHGPFAVDIFSYP